MDSVDIPCQIKLTEKSACFIPLSLIRTDYPTSHLVDGHFFGHIPVFLKNVSLITEKKGDDHFPSTNPGSMNDG